MSFPLYKNFCSVITVSVCQFCLCCLCIVQHIYICILHWYFKQCKLKLRKWKRNIKDFESQIYLPENKHTRGRFTTGWNNEVAQDSLQDEDKSTEVSVHEPTYYKKRTAKITINTSPFVVNKSLLEYLKYDKKQPDNPYQKGCYQTLRT